jgi:hypothetical protein
MWFHFLKWLPIALLAAPVLLWGYANLRTTRQARIALGIASALGAIVVILMIAAALARLPNDHWSASRLAPTVSMFNGYRLYYGPGEGPVLVRMYGPVPWLIYAPAALMPAPTPAMFAAAAINLLCFTLPALWVIRRSCGYCARTEIVVAAVLFAVIIVFTWPLLDVASSVTVDAPAIGFAAAACAVVIGSSRPISMRHAVLAGVFAALSAWSKQTMWPLVLAPPLYVLAAVGWRAAARFWLGYFGTIVIFSTVLVLILDPREMFFNMYTVPASQPWQWPWLERPWALLRAAKLIWRECALGAIVLVAAFLIRRDLPRAGSGGGREWLRRNPWIPLLGVAILVLPTTAAAYAKIGGRANNAAACAYFTALAGAVALIRSHRTEPTSDPLNGRARLATLLVITLIIAIPALSWRQLRRVPAQLAHWRELRDNQQSLALRYARDHPGQVLFPQHPLATLMAHGRLSHFEEGVRDLRLAGIDISEQQLRAGLPQDLRAIAYPGEGGGLMLELLPEFRRATRDPRLPGWTLWVREAQTAD